MGAGAGAVPEGPWLEVEELWVAEEPRVVMLLLFTPDVQDTRVAWLLFLPFWSATALCFLVRVWCLRAVMPEWEKLKLHLHHLNIA